MYYILIFLLLRMVLLYFKFVYSYDYIKLKKHTTGFCTFYYCLVVFSYVKGHILLTWDLGAGPRRIFTKRPVDERYFVHSVQFGRYGRLGYLQVDNFPNITGRAPGLRENLNITSKVKMSIFIIWRT